MLDRPTTKSAWLDRAAALARPGGRIAYITCSFLPAENDGTVDAFLQRHPAFRSLPTAAAAADAGLPGLPDRAWPCRHGLQLTPLRTGTDGFYVALLRRQD